ncbi:MAG: class II glutamine amidotransferase [Clostridia bacterium]|nr:class II glutamine amidotransferase [Clostridia bacterium]
MCGLFGHLNYSGEKIKNISDLTNSLAEQSAVRGTDATGIAFCSGGNVNILKESKSAYRLNFKLSDDTKAIIGHTRHSTQGSEKKNYNNHPFPAKCSNARFALAHNGVLSNDKELRHKFKLPKTKIETDSYIAVQLIESQKHLDFDSIKYMAERTEGSFSYSILDDKNNIWLVKGDSPLSILHFPKLKMYVYASTDEILYKALVDYQPLFKALKNGDFEEIGISEGDILKIRPDGILERNTFEYSYYYGRGWWDYGSFSSISLGNGKPTSTRNEYLESLKSIASYQGYSPEDVDELIVAGFTLDEIEDYLYCGGEI